MLGDTLLGVQRAVEYLTRAQPIPGAVLQSPPTAADAKGKAGNT